MNDTQYMKLAEVANKSVDEYNNLLKEKKEKIEQIERDYNRKIDSAKEHAIQLSEGMLNTYFDPYENLIVDCSDELNEAIIYETKSASDWEKEI